MTSIADHAVKIQTTSESNPSPPFWFGEVVLMSSSLRKHSVLSKISEQVRFARKRFGCYETIDFLAVLFGYAISGERTLEEFYQRIQPFAVPFMALFDRDQLPSRSALSRFLAALTEAPVEALRTLFLDDLLVRPPRPTSKLETCWIEQEPPGSCSTSMGRERQRGSARCPRPMSFLQPFVGWMTCAPLATEAANAGRLFARAQRFLKPIAIIGSAVSETKGTAITGRNCARDWLRSHAISPRISSNLRIRCSDSTGSMVRGLHSPR